MKQVLYMHTGSGNHGCEAIVRTTGKLLGTNDTILWSLSKNEDISYGIDDYVSRIVESEEIKRFTRSYFEALIRRKIFKQDKANMQIFLRDLFSNNIAISIGGDNYCYPWSANQAVILDKEIRKWCKSTVLWGCSIDKEAITPEVEEDLKQFNLITARESLTYEILKPINPNTVLVADSAFLLDTVNLPLPKQFMEGNTVGINISPLIMKYGTDNNLILNNYMELIKYILTKTDMNICFIPHVIWSYNNDLEPIRYLVDKVNNNERVCMIEDGLSTALKGYISRCRFFVGARTHATIAAYSSNVPTLVVGYSIKSRGIANDLFGTDNNFVLPVQNLNTIDDLTSHFVWLLENEYKIKNHLKKVIPDYKKKAIASAKLIDELKKQ